MISLVTRDDRACTRQTSLPPNLTATERKETKTMHGTTNELALFLDQPQTPYDAASAAAADAVDYECVDRAIAAAVDGGGGARGSV